ncbi:MarR family winged helix-turn-helix transcriptional regulator [Paracoccus homiensis]|uniref:DNA-binding transcriptional regulator, MarR family n=1 Tax=Paracoccus homiensis TaxID=364199 RepID=A0A1I0BXQ4_9RHOB|nr:MarR family transcriptional regulator [Paracoccus homiensis]SET11897.1 DNA-binding transcriptional regulator, MarR family [Paracoccus homiensis]
MSDTPDERIDNALIALRRILRATELYERELAQAAKLTPAKLRVLQILASRDGRSATPTALAQQMGVSQATVTALVDQLEKRGFARRERSSTDRRQNFVTLTDDGGAALKSAPSALQQNFVGSFQKLENWEQLMTIAVLDRVAGMLNAGEIDASPVLTIGDIRKPRPPA